MVIYDDHYALAVVRTLAAPFVLVALLWVTPHVHQDAPPEPRDESGPR